MELDSLQTHTANLPFPKAHVDMHVLSRWLTEGGGQECCRTTEVHKTPTLTSFTSDTAK